MQQALVETLGTRVDRWHRVLLGPALKGHAEARDMLQARLERLEAEREVAAGTLANILLLPALHYLERRGFVWDAEGEGYRLGIPSLAVDLEERLGMGATPAPSAGLSA